MANNQREQPAAPPRPATTNQPAVPPEPVEMPRHAAARPRAEADRELVPPDADRELGA